MGKIFVNLLHFILIKLRPIAKKANAMNHHVGPSSPSLAKKVENSKKAKALDEDGLDGNEDEAGPSNFAKKMKKK